MLRFSAFLNNLVTPKLCWRLRLRLQRLHYAPRFLQLRGRIPIHIRTMSRLALHNSIVLDHHVWLLTNSGQP